MLNAKSAIPHSIFIPDEFELIETKYTYNDINDKFKFELSKEGIYSVINLSEIPYVNYELYDHVNNSFYSLDDFGVPHFFKGRGGRHNNIYHYTDIFTENNISRDIKLNVYKPISLKIENVEIEDITNYSQPNKNDLSALNFRTPGYNRSFIYDFKNRIYTNFNLAEFTTIDITFERTISNFKVVCSMDSNTSGVSNYTPIVDYYIIKCTGQNIR